MTIRKSFLFNTLFTLFVNLLIKPVWVFGIDRTVQNRLGEAEYGMYFTIINFTYLFQIVLDFGLQNYNQTEIASDTGKLRKTLPGLLFVKMLLSTLYFLLVSIIGIVMGYAWKDFFFWLLINQILMSLNIFLRSNISAHRLFVQDAFLSVIDKILMISGCSLLLMGLLPEKELSILHFVLIQTISLGITTFICILFILRLQPVFAWKPDKELLLKIFRESLPFAAAYFLMTLYYRVDTVMIEKMLGAGGAEEAGIYAQSYRIMESVNNLGYLMAGVLLPLFAYRLGSSTSFKEELKHGYGLMLTMAAPIIAGGFIYSDNIILALYPGRDSLHSASIFRILLINFFPVAMLYVAGPLLTANKNFKWMLSSMVIAVFANIFLNYHLIPVYGAWGAAIATLITQIFMLLSYCWAMMHIFKLKPGFKILTSSMVLVLIAVAAAWLPKAFHIHWIPALAICASISLIASWKLKIISADSWKLKID
jgi:O-antigen/teichoic acid export membrane protein